MLGGEEHIPNGEMEVVVPAVSGPVVKKEAVVEVGRILESEGDRIFLMFLLLFRPSHQGLDRISVQNACGLEGISGENIDQIFPTACPGEAAGLIKQIWGRLTGGERQGDLVGVVEKIILIPAAPGFFGCGSPGAEQVGPGSLQQGGRGDGLLERRR